jgi:hypothetical protein
MMHAAAAHKLATNAARRANLERILNEVSECIKDAATVGAFTTYLTPKALGIKGDRIGLECGMASIARELEGAGYKVTYTYEGMRINW